MLEWLAQADPLNVFLVLLELVAMAALMVGFLFCVYTHCCRLKRLTDKDEKAFGTFKELYRRRNIEVTEDLFDVNRDPECGCLETLTAKQPADGWSTSRRHLGSNFDLVVQVAEKIDEALLEYQHRVATHEGLNSSGMPTAVVQKFGAKYPHYPAFIVAQEWRDWANHTIIKFNSFEARNGLLDEVKKRLEWLESVELGLADPGITDLHESYGWDNQRLSLLQVFTRDVTPRLTEMRDTVDRSILEQSHAEVLNACFNLTKRLILECMRFFECVAHTSSLRVKSEIVDHEHALPQALWYLSAQYLCKETREEMDQVPQSWSDHKAYERFQKLGHLDKCLTAWYAYMRPQLLERVTPEETERDVWQALLDANNTYKAHFSESGKHGFNFDEYKQNGRSEARESLREWHYQGLKTCLNSWSLCLDKDQLEKLLDVMSFFLSRTLFATNQMANICLLQSSLSLLTGRLYINRLLSKNHILCTIMFMDAVTRQLTNQVNEIKEILLQGWQKARRQMRRSHWANTRPLDNFRLAMQAKRAVDKNVGDLQFILAKLRSKVTSVSLKSEKDLKEEKDKHMLLYMLTWRNAIAWQQHPFAPLLRERVAPDWAQEEFLLDDSLAPENMQNFARRSVCERQWTSFHSTQSLNALRAAEEAEAEGSEPEAERCPLLCGTEAEAQTYVQIKAD